MVAGVWPVAGTGPVPAVALAAAGLLLAAGTAKIRQPAPAVAALTGAGLRLPRGLVRLGGVLEVCCAAGLILAGGHRMAAQGAAAGCAACYLAFSVFLVVALRRGAPSCGCTGRPDTPPTGSHLALTLSAAGACAAAVAVPGSAATVWSGAAGPGTLAAAGVLAVTGWLVVAVLPALSAERRRLAAGVLR
jgi:hypothetical protein